MRDCKMLKQALNIFGCVIPIQGAVDYYNMENKDYRISVIVRSSDQFLKIFKSFL